MLPSSLPLPHLWKFLLPHLWKFLFPLPAPDKISRFRVRFRFQSLLSKCFRFHKNLTASTAFSFRFHIHVCNSCNWLGTRFHKLQVTLLGLLGSATCQHVQQPQQKEGAYHKHIAATADHSKTSSSDAVTVLVVRGADLR